MFKLLHTGPRVDGSRYPGDFLLNWWDAFCDWKQDRFGAPRLYISTVSF